MCVLLYVCIFTIRENFNPVSSLQSQKFLISNKNLEESNLWLLHGWCHVKLLPSQPMFCVHHTPRTSLQCHFMHNHIHMVHVCLAVTCHLHFWQNDWDLLHATAVIQGVEQIPK